MPGHEPGTLKWPQPPPGTSAAPPAPPSGAGCQRQSPLIDRRSRVGVDSRKALSRSQTAFTPAGRATSGSWQTPLPTVPAASAATSEMRARFLMIIALSSSILVRLPEERLDRPVRQDEPRRIDLREVVPRTVETAEGQQEESGEDVAGVEERQRGEDHHRGLVPPGEPAPLWEEPADQVHLDAEEDVP